MIYVGISVCPCAHVTIPVLLCPWKKTQPWEFSPTFSPLSSPPSPPSNHRGGHSKAKLIPLLAGARDGTLTENKAKGRNTSSGTRWTPGIAPNSGIQFSHKTVNHNSSTHFSPLFGKTAFISRSGARPVGTDRPAHNKSRETARVWCQSAWQPGFCRLCKQVPVLTCRYKSQ